MAQRAFTFQDLAADFKLTLHDMASGVTLDANGKIASIANSFGNGANPAITANTNSARRHSPVTYNGYPTAFSDSTSYDGILISDTSAFPKGNEDRYMMVINLSQDGIVFGYRGDGANIYCVDNPYNPGYRLYTTGNPTLTGTTAPSANSLHCLELVHQSSVTRMYVDGALNGTLNAVLATTIKKIGIKGAEADYYTMKGYMALALMGKRAPTQDEQWRIQWKAAQITGRPLPASNPYYNTTPMVDDGATTIVTGSSFSTIASFVAASAAGLAIVGAASLALAGIGSTSTASPPTAAQAQASLGAIASAGIGSISATGAAATSLQSIGTAGAGTLPVHANGTIALADVVSGSTGAISIAGAASTTLDPIDTVSASRADVRGSANTKIGSVAGSSTAGGQSLATASAASVLGSVSTGSTGSAPLAGNASIALAPTASNSGAAAAVRGAGAIAFGSIVAASSAGLPVGALGAAVLGGVQSAAAGAALVSGVSSVELAAISGTAFATVGQDTGGQLVGPGWTVSAIPRRFVASAIRRSFIVSSTGCKRMLNFPPKYAHKVRNAVVDFAPALSNGEGLIGQPTVAVMKGDLAVSAARIEGAAVHFTLSGGTAAAKVVQWVEVHCPTDGDQVLEEVVSVAMLS
jgi:hypothetical protein